jgi:hypothetical protein
VWLQVWRSTTSQYLVWLVVLVAPVAVDGDVLQTLRPVHWRQRRLPQQPMQCSVIPVADGEQESVHRMTWYAAMGLAEAPTFEETGWELLREVAMWLLLEAAVLVSTCEAILL